MARLRRAGSPPIVAPPHDCPPCSIGTPCRSSPDLVHLGSRYRFASLLAMMARLQRACRLRWLAIESSVRLVADTVDNWFSVLRGLLPRDLRIGLAQMLKSTMAIEICSS